MEYGSAFSGGMASPEMGATEGRICETGKRAYEESGEKDTEGGPDESYAENVGFVCHTCEALIRPEQA